MDDSMTKPPRLLDEVRRVMRTAHYSLRTEEAYVGWIRRFILFHGKRHPLEMGEAEVGVFLSDLALAGSMWAASTQNQALSSLLFLYGKVLDRPLDRVCEITPAKRPRRLPVVMDRNEIRAVLAQLDGTRWLMASLLYGSGLRLMECLRLRVKDVEFGSGRLVVRNEKGGVDRMTVLPGSVRDPLARQIERVGGDSSSGSCRRVGSGLPAGYARAEISRCGSIDGLAVCLSRQKAGA